MPPAARITDTVQHPRPPLRVDRTGSATVMINHLPAGRQNDTILEAVGPPNRIAMGCPAVLTGG